MQSVLLIAVLAQAYPIYTTPVVIDATGQSTQVQQSPSSSFPSSDSFEEFSSSSSSFSPSSTFRQQSSSSSSREGLSDFTQNILNREPSGNFQPVNVQVGDCPAEEEKDGGIFGFIPDINNCEMFGPVPRLNDFWPRGS